MSKAREDFKRIKSICSMSVHNYVRELESVIGLESPWPLSNVLETLVSASEKLLDKYNYDGEDHEEINITINRAKEILSILLEIKK